MKSATAEIADVELVEQPRTDQLPATTGSTALAEVNAGPLAMAMQAMKAGMSIADMRDMLNLQKEWEANEARKAFVDAMAAFKKNPPAILKDKHVEFATSKGTTSYDHATIGNVCDAIIKAAAEYGFSHRWIPSKGEHGELVITCEVTHRLGHSQLTPLEGPRDDSGTKNVLQANQSTRTYLQRHSLLLAFGFATKDQPDDDGRAAGGGDQYDAAGTLQTWTERANAAINLPTLNETRKMAGHEFNAAKDVAGWNAFKAVVERKRAELVAGGAQ
jgi:hypothetical protein